MAEDDSQKTEEPTAKKIAKARSEGQVAQSRDLNSWAYLVTATILIVVAFPVLLGHMVRVFVVVIQASSETMRPSELFLFLRDQVIKQIAINLIPILISFLLVALAISWSQFGLLFATKKLEPKLSHISPLKGVKRMFSPKSLVEFLKGLLKIGAVIMIAWWVLLPEFRRVEHVMYLEIHSFMPVWVGVFIKLMVAILMFLFFLAMFDVAWQNHTNKKELRMSRKEVKDERKQSDGSPEIKQRIAKIRNERARTKILETVPESDVVITNPTHYAVALKYDPKTMAAPILMAKGLDKLALKIREIADEHNVPIVENPPLARALYATGELEQEIDPEHYEAVATIIKYVWELKNRKF